MSDIIRQVNTRYLAHIVRTVDGKYYYVDTAETYDRGWETMVFPWNEEAQEVCDWGDLYAREYRTSWEAKALHGIICRELESHLEEGTDEEVEE